MFESKSLSIYNCQACMFITKNKKDYQRHLQSKKHRVSAFHTLTIVAKHDDTITDETFQKPPMCSNCHKVYKSRTSVYKHMKQCGVNTQPPSLLTPLSPLSPPPPLHETLSESLPSPESLTTEQIQNILIENRILKELLKKAIHGSLV
jgi:uncharacterized C2H2 Zn-finger protein